MYNVQCICISSFTITQHTMHTFFFPTARTACADASSTGVASVYIYIYIYIYRKRERERDIDIDDRPRGPLWPIAVNKRRKGKRENRGRTGRPDPW